MNKEFVLHPADEIDVDKLERLYWELKENTDV